MAKTMETTIVFWVWGLGVRADLHAYIFNILVYEVIALIQLHADEREYGNIVSSHAW